MVLVLKAVNSELIKKISIALIVLINVLLVVTKIIASIVRILPIISYLMDNVYQNANFIKTVQRHAIKAVINVSDHLVTCALHVQTLQSYCNKELVYHHVA